MTRIKPSYWAGLTRHSGNPSTSYDASCVTWDLGWFSSAPDYSDMYKFVTRIE